MSGANKKLTHLLISCLVLHSAPAAAVALVVVVVVVVVAVAVALLVGFPPVVLVLVIVVLVIVVVVLVLVAAVSVLEWLASPDSELLLDHDSRTCSSPLQNSKNKPLERL